MARLQILELPEASGDERPPFILVIDQVDYDSLSSLSAALEGWQNIKDQIGARAVLVFAESVEIPANEVPVDPDGYPLMIRVEGDFEKFHKQVQEETLYAQGKTTRALRATDQDRKDSLTDALGMDRTRDWDDIRNAAAALRKERDAQAAEVERLRAGEEPVTDERVTPNPGQWIYQWNRATAEKRLDMATQLLDGMPRANNCLMLDHEARLADLQTEVQRLRTAKPDA